MLVGERRVNETHRQKTAGKDQLPATNLELALTVEFHHQGRKALNSGLVAYGTNPATKSHLTFKPSNEKRNNLQRMQICVDKQLTQAVLLKYEERSKIQRDNDLPECDEFVNARQASQWPSPFSLPGLP